MTTEVVPLIPFRQHPIELTGGVREPWLCRAAIEWLDSRLNDKMRGLEWGCGTSTEWYCRRLGSLWSIEHDTIWAEKVFAFMQNFPDLAAKWHLSVFPGSVIDEGRVFLGADKLWHKVYAELSCATGQFDFVCVDGRARNACLRTAVRLIRRPGGLLVLDNSQRKKYDRSAIPATWDRQEWSNGTWSTAIWETT